MKFNVYIGLVNRDALIESKFLWPSNDLGVYCVVSDGTIYNDQDKTQHKSKLGFKFSEDDEIVLEYI